MEKIKNMWENLALPKLLYWAIILWVPALLVIMAIMPTGKVKFLRKEIVKIIREIKK